jgi:hypothetical protein
MYMVLIPLISYPDFSTSEQSPICLLLDLA